MLRRHRALLSSRAAHVPVDTTPGCQAKHMSACGVATAMSARSAGARPWGRVKSLAQSLPTVSAAAAFGLIAPAIALTDLTALLFVEAGAAQPLAVRHTFAALGAISTTVAFAYFAALLLVHTGAPQTLAVVAVPILDLLHSAFRNAGAAKISADGCRHRAWDAPKTKAGSEDSCTDDCSHGFHSL
jgi:hypothetical protein